MNVAAYRTAEMSLKPMIRLFVRVLALVVCTSPLAGATTGVQEHRESQNNEKQIKQIDDILTSIIPPIESEEFFEAQIAELQAFSSSLLIDRLLHFAASARSMEQATVPGIVLNKIGIDDAELVAHVGKHLTDSDGAIAEQARNWLMGTVDHDSERGPDFSNIRMAMETYRRANEDIPRDLISFMLDQDAEQALIVCMKVFEVGAEQQRQIRWAAHVVDELSWRARWGYEIDEQTIRIAREELERLASSDEWWIRMYVDDQLKKFPSVLTDRLREFQKQLRDAEAGVLKGTHGAVSGGL